MPSGPSYIKGKINNTQQDSKCRLYGDRDEAINHITNEYSKLIPKGYRTKHDRVGKVIHCKIV